MSVGNLVSLTSGVLALLIFLLVVVLQGNLGAVGHKNVTVVLKPNRNVQLNSSVLFKI